MPRPIPGSPRPAPPTGEWQPVWPSTRARPWSSSLAWPGQEVPLWRSMVEGWGNGGPDRDTNVDNYWKQQNKKHGKIL